MAENRHVHEIYGPVEFAAQFSVSRETIEKLELYAALLQRWQKTINLVAPSTLGQIWQRHFADSAQLLRFAPEKADYWVDLGSGAGFPGLVIALLRADGGEKKALPPVILVESDQRKCAFLREIARQTLVAVDILPERIELGSIQAKIERIDVISARALAPLSSLMALAGPFAGPQTTCLFSKGKGVRDELAEARRTWDFSCRLGQSLTDDQGKIAIITDLNAKTEG